MRKRFHLVTRDLHLYLGLFVSPFILVFAVSVFVLVHPLAHSGDTQRLRNVQDLRLEPGVENLAGRERVDALRRVLDQAGVRGEIGFVRHLVKEHRLIVPVEVPGRETSVDIDLLAHTAKISEAKTGALGSLIFLHKSPGPHLTDIRMNWLPMRIWRWLADGTVYLVIFISASGVYLWLVLRSERYLGIVLLVAGAMSFMGIMYALAG